MATKAADNRWGQVKWGQTKWGASASQDKIGWGIEIDWDGDGLFEVNEANRATAIRGFRGRTNALQPAGSGFQPLQSGKFEITLDNYDGRYDAWNTSGPLYPNVTYGKDVRIRARDMNGSATPYPVFYGIIADIIPHRDLNGNQTVVIQMEDAWVYLRNNKARVAVQTSISLDTAIGLVLDSIGWPVRWGRDLDASTDTPTYFWALNDQNAGKLIQDVADSGLGTFFIAADGKATYRIRTNYPSAALSISQDMVYKDIVPAQPWVNFRNVIKFTANPRTGAAGATLWKSNNMINSPPIQPGETLKFIAKYTYNGSPCAAINVAQPVMTTDWDTSTSATSNAFPDTTTANCTLSITDFGDSALVQATNNNVGVVYLILLQIIGTALYVAGKLEATSPTDVSTVTNPREFNQDLVWQQDVNSAQDFAGVLRTFYSTQFPFMAVKMSGRPSSQFIPDIWDTVSVTFPKLGLSGYSMRVAGIGIESQGSMQDILTTFYLEPYPTVLNAAIYDTSVYDTGTFGW